MKHHLIASLLLSTSLISAAAHGDDFTVAAPIEKVVVYRDGGAMVTRRGTVHMPAGEHTITVNRLPDFLDEDDAPIANFPAANTHLQGLTLSAGYSVKPSSEQQEALTAQIESLNLQIQTLQNKIQAKNMQLSFIRSLNKRQEDGGDAVMTVDDWGKALAFVGEQSADILAAIQGFEQASIKLKKSRSALQRELKATGAVRQDFTKAVLAVDNAVEGDVAFELSYFIEDAEWSLDVAARLDTGANKLAVRSSAAISQDSGEDWTDVSLALSNNQPSNELGEIKQEAKILTLIDPSEYRSRFIESDSLRKESASPNLEEIVMTGSRITRKKATKFDRLYEISGKTSIPSTDEKEHVPLGSAEADTALVIRSLPSTDRTAYLFVDTKFSGLESARDIEATLSRDGHYVGQGSWPDLENNIDLSLPYGEDPAVEITYIEQAPEDGKKGFISRSNVKESRFLIGVTNHHSEAVTVEIFDQTPVSGHEDIDVRTIDGATRPTETDMDGKEGLKMWRKTVAPGEVWEIKHRYRVTFPAGSALGQK